MTISQKPFGMLFEEDMQLVSDGGIVPEYDASESLSFIVDSQGIRRPFILEKWCFAKTGTDTLVQAEGSDSDQELGSLATQTITKAQGEGADDDSQNIIFGTGTETRVKMESNDDDMNSVYRTLVTQTLTEVRREETDSDS